MSAFQVGDMVSLNYVLSYLMCQIFIHAANKPLRAKRPYDLPPSHGYEGDLSLFSFSLDDFLHHFGTQAKSSLFMIKI